MVLRLSLVIALALTAPQSQERRSGVAPTASTDGQGSVTCSFSHPSYSGYCKQTQQIPENGTANGVCQDILSCLNNTQCSKTYCNATEIRGGWKLESVQAAPPKS